MANATVQSHPTQPESDGPPTASIANTTLCYDCAQDVSDYFQARRKDAEEDVDSPGPFGEADAQALLERLAENDRLVLGFENKSGYGIRSVADEWKSAVIRGAYSPVVQTLTREEVRDHILNANRLVIKQLDSSAWERFEGEDENEFL